ncbi:MAG: hypothetical protein PHF35_05120 [Candidatus Moranbacteria bacterium]|nr:hypothetical protein [Candidatus Moranbacteria bacterium]
MEQIPAQNAEINIDRKSKVLFVFLGILIIGSIAGTYWKIVVKRDYMIQAQIDCDPAEEKCFVWECDPNSTEEGEACTGDPESDIWYYKILNRNAKNIPLCDPDTDENCTAYECNPGEKDCSEEFCDEENVPDGESCNDPEQYLIENPQEECAEDDKECLGEETEEACAPDGQECLGAQDEEENVSGDEDYLQGQDGNEASDTYANDTEGE